MEGDTGSPFSTCGEENQASNLSDVYEIIDCYLAEELSAVEALAAQNQKLESQQEEVRKNCNKYAEVDDVPSPNKHPKIVAPYSAW